MVVLTVIYAHRAGKVADDRFHPSRARAELSAEILSTRVNIYVAREGEKERPGRQIFGITVGLNRPSHLSAYCGAVVNCMALFRR